LSENIYETPKSDLAVDENKQGVKPLASRWKRLFASLLDSLIMMVVIVPIIYLTGGFDVLYQEVQPSLVYNLLIALAGVIVFFVINGTLLVQNGQTIGKKLLSIKIVNLNGQLPTFKRHLIKRYFVYLIPGQIPLVGQIFSIVNILFIFTKEKQCIHDLFAKTIVIDD